MQDALLFSRNLQLHVCVGDAKKLGCPFPMNVDGCVTALLSELSPHQNPLETARVPMGAGNRHCTVESTKRKLPFRL